MPTTISADDVVLYLRARGVIGASDAAVSVLSGGVSGLCLLVESAAERVVVKQALSRLAVEKQWTAKRERALTEAAALRLFHSITPCAVPEVLDVDRELFAFTMTAAPSDYRPWKEALLSEPVDPAAAPQVAAELGTLLGSWHSATWHDPEAARDFADYEAFEQLRIAPFHRAVARRHPDLADPIERCVDELSHRREAVVHGDFSPKNVLVGSGPSWVIDFEVAHVGATVFDLAFLHCHLILKAVHRATEAGALAAAAREFTSSYRDRQPVADGHALLGWQTACLLLARVDGTSPAGYLTASESTVVREIAARALSTPSIDIDGLWHMMMRRGAA